MLASTSISSGDRRRAPRPATFPRLDGLSVESSVEPGPGGISGFRRAARCIAHHVITITITTV